jgi:chromosome segregation ATPase
MSELQGQMGMGALLGAAEPVREEAWGYDAEGRLLAQEEVAPAVSADADQRAEALASEIRAIKEQTRGVVISAALSIGARLIEAKALIPFGAWGAWLEAHVDYSERKAQDLMRLYEEYGKKTIPQAIAALDYTKALALLALPEEQRGEMAERISAEGLSARQLQAEIAKLKDEAKAAQVQIEDLILAGERKDEAAKAAEAAIRAEREAAERARGAVVAAEDSAEELRRTLTAVRSGREAEAQRAADAVQRANATAEENRKLREKLAAMEAEKPEPERVEVVPEEVQRELDRLRLQAAQGAGPRDAAVLKLRDGYGRLTEEFRRVEGLLGELKEQDADEAARFAGALAKAARMMAERFEHEIRPADSMQ